MEVKQKLLDALTVAKFRAWILDQPLGFCVGQAGSVCNCPIANYLQLHMQGILGPIAVGRKGVYNHITDEIYLPYEEMPKWVKEFGKIADDIWDYNNKIIPRSYALEHLAAAQLLGGEVEGLEMQVKLATCKGNPYWKCWLWQQGKEEITKMQINIPHFMYPEELTIEDAAHIVGAKASHASLKCSRWIESNGWSMTTRAVGDYKHCRSVRQKMMKLMEVE